MNERPVYPSVAQISVSASDESTISCRPYPSSGDVEKDISILQVLESIVPEIDTLTRFLERRRKRLAGHEQYMRAGYPAAIANIRGCYHKDQLNVWRNREQHADSQVAVESPGGEQSGYSDIDVQEMQRPSWTRRWSAWIAPSWQEADKEHARIQPGTITAIEANKGAQLEQLRKKSVTGWNGAIREPPRHLHRPAEQLCLNDQGASTYLGSSTHLNTPPLPPLKSPHDLVMGLPLLDVSDSVNRDTHSAELTNRFHIPIVKTNLDTSPPKDSLLLPCFSEFRMGDQSFSKSASLNLDSQDILQQQHSPRGSTNGMDQKTVRTFSASVAEAESPKMNEPPRFQKIRTRRLGRSSSLSCAVRAAESVPKVPAYEKAGPQNTDSVEKPVMKRSTSTCSSKARHYQEVIWTDIETDIEEVPDNGIDTDTDREGRAATRCLALDPLDGQPHPFWGVEAEQSSWVSIPNPAKLDPECKVLRMLKAMKSPHGHNSHLLLRHYKAFLKYGIYPEYLFEIWGRCNVNEKYKGSETEKRELLSRLERELTVSPAYRVGSSGGVHSDKLTSQEKDMAWIRRRVAAFRKQVRKEVGFPPPTENDDIAPIHISCPVDPTWRNVYSSRVKVPKRQKRKIELANIYSIHVDEFEKLLENDSGLLGRLDDTSASPCLDALGERSVTGGREPTSLQVPGLIARFSGSTSASNTPAHIDNSAFSTGSRSTSGQKAPHAFQTPRPGINIKRFPSCPSWTSSAAGSESICDTTGSDIASKFLTRRATTHEQLGYGLMHYEMEVGGFQGPVKASPLFLDSAASTYSQLETGGAKSRRVKQHEEQQDVIEAAVIARATAMAKRSKSFVSYAATASETDFDLSQGIERAGSGSTALTKKTSTARSDTSPLAGINNSSNVGMGTTSPDATAVVKQWQLQMQAAHYRKMKECRERLKGRGKLKTRRGRVTLTQSPDVQREGEAWTRFHQIRDERPMELWPPLPPSPVPNPSFISYASENRRGGPWPSFIPTIFRGPGRYEDVQEALLQILWTTRNTPLVLPAPKKESLKIWIGGFMIPHDEKRFRYGDDSWCGSEPLCCLGVCDGVGEMSDTQWRAAGFDCRGFGEDILREAKSRLQMIRSHQGKLRGSRPRMVLERNHRRCDKAWNFIPFELDPKQSNPSLLALESLICGYYHKTTTWGAATCLFGCLNENGSKIGFANIGDSRAAIFRRGDFSTGPLTFVGFTEPEQHGWNLPVQLARLPDRSRVRSMREDPRLQELVKTLDACRATGQDINDPAESAVLYDFNLQEGDLIVIGTDGLWDNVFENEVSALCGLGISPYESNLMCGTPFTSTAPRDIAKGLCLAAYWRSLHANIDTPFAQSVRSAGGVMLGGKPDDITAVAAWVVPASEENTPELLTRCQKEERLTRERAQKDLRESSSEDW